MRRATLVVLLLAAACGSAGGPGLPGGPAAPPRGKPSGLSASGSIDASGGTLTLSIPDGSQLELVVPPGAVQVATVFTIDDLTIADLTGTVGTGYRLGPSALVPAAALTLVFTPPTGTAPAGLTAAYQAFTGYWSRVYSVARDSSTVQVQTTFIGDWSLVTVATQLDLHGPFRLDNNMGVPFTAEGNVTLQYLSDGFYLPQGDITLLTPVTNGAASCTPPGGATLALPDSIAELTATSFAWGINGDWKLSCNDGSSAFVSTDFDSLGITNLECARSWAAGYAASFDPTHVQGQYVVDCGAAGRVVASWDLVAPGDTPPDPSDLPPPP